MRIIALAALAAALTLSTPAVAQNYQLNSVTATARQVFASCVSMSRKEGAANPAAACACVTGYMAGAMNDRDFEVAKTLLRVGEMTENGTSQATIEAEIMAFFERGFTEADVERVAAAGRTDEQPRRRRVRPVRQSGVGLRATCLRRPTYARRSGGFA